MHLNLIDMGIKKPLTTGVKSIVSGEGEMEEYS